MKTWLAQSIARKLLASLLAIFLVTYVLTAAFVYTSVRSSMMRTESEGLTRLANQKLELASDRLQATAINMSAWSQLDVMNDLLSGDVDRRVARTLASLKRQYALAGDIYAFDAGGALVAASGAHGAGARLPPQWASRAEGAALTERHSHPFVSAPVVALTIGIKASFASGLRTGTLVVTLPWSAIEQWLDAGDNRILLYTDEHPQLLSGRGLGPPEPDQLAMLAQRAPELTIGGTRYLAGYSAIYRPLLHDWHMAAVKESQVAFAPVRLVALKLAGLGLLLALPMVLAIRWLSRRLTGPVQALTAVVSDITRSADLSRRVARPGSDELGTLAVAFNAMAGNLEHISSEREKVVSELELLNKTLEQRVLERTSALAAANGELQGAIDQLKAAQSQLVQSEKMASLGQLVAGVAHELNNPISFIYANFPHLEEHADTLFGLVEQLRQLPLDVAGQARSAQLIAQAELDFVRQDMLKIIRSGKSGAARIKEIVSSLRSFSRLDEAELKSVTLEDGIDDTLAILHHLIKNRIEVSKDYRLAQPVLCRAGQINQVFMNIIYNALQAIDGAGTLRISTAREGQWAVVRIADSGKGIAPDIIGKIFDPFFTTKKVGDGTGLGLSISYGIVEKHGGHIEVQSELGKGTVFSVYLPFAAPENTV